MNDLLDKSKDLEVTKAFGKKNISKVDRYCWAKENLQWGEYRMIPKRKLHIDGAYQRGKVSTGIINAIASNFDAVAFQALIVSERKDGSLWVIEGGQRARGAMKRDDIDLVPCIVHKCETKEEEAKKFLAINEYRKNICAMDRFKANICVKDKITLETDDLVKKCGYESSASPGPYKFQAISTLVRLMKMDSCVATDIFTLLAEIAGGDRIDSKALWGMFTLTKELQPGIYLPFDKDITTKLKKEGIIAINKFIKDEEYEAGKGGVYVSANGIRRLLNKGKRTRRLTAHRGYGID